jgi:hypothetical protein
MPIIAVEEDYDEVSRLLLVVPEEMTSTNPSEKNVSTKTLSLSMSSSVMEVETQEQDDNNNDENKEGGDVFEFCNLSSSNHSDQLNRSIGNSNHSSSRRRGVSSSSSPSFLIRNTTSISSIKRSNSIIVVTEEDYDYDNNNDDSADNSMNTFENISIPSTTNLSELYNNDPLNISLSNRSISRSIGNSTSSRQYRQYQNSSSNNMKRSTSTGSKLLELVDVVPIKDVDIDTKYYIDYSREIGRGTKTIVRKCIERSTGNRYAVKTVKKSDKVEYDHMRQETNLLSALNHPSIIKVYDTYEDQKYLHIVVEICKGGELYDHVIETYNNNNNSNSNSDSENNNKNKIESISSDEEVAAVVVRRVVDAVAYLHDHDIVHRDLKVCSVYVYLPALPASPAMPVLVCMYCHIGNGGGPIILPVLLTFYSFFLSFFLF